MNKSLTPNETVKYSWGPDSCSQCQNKQVWILLMQHKEKKSSKIYFHSQIYFPKINTGTKDFRVNNNNNKSPFLIQIKDVSWFYQFQVPRSIMVYALLAVLRRVMFALQ